MRAWPTIVLVAFLHAGVAIAVTLTPVGLWKTIDDHSHKPRALVEINNIQGVLKGRIVRLFPAPGVDARARCGQCSGSRHDQPVLGMTILWGLRDEGGRWSDGRILDPETGHVYHCVLRLSDHGDRLQVRGYIGLPLFGRTQTWLRASSAAPSASP